MHLFKFISVVILNSKARKRNASFENIDYCEYSVMRSLREKVFRWQKQERLELICYRFTAISNRDLLTTSNPSNA